MLTEWLGCYVYIPPKDRCLYHTLPTLLLAELLKTLSVREATFRLSEFMNIADSYLTEQDQEEIITYLKQGTAK
jgi:hypothetical protein